MNESLFPTYTGIAIVILAYWLQRYKGPGHRHVVLGTGMILCSLFCWLGGVFLFLSGFKMRAFMDFAAPLIFFEGIAFFLRQAPGAKKSNNHGPLGHKFVMTGVGVGLTNAALMAFTGWWPMTLITFYAWIGFHGPAIDRLHAHQF